MQRRWISLATSISALIGSSWVGETTLAQTTTLSPLGGAGTGNVPVAAAMANPYMNPYLNPYLNPMATQQPMTGRDAALYMYMANSARGGLGSGQISGTRPLPGTAVNQNQGKAQPGRPNKLMQNKPLVNGRRPVEEMPDSVSMPGGAAARFFNPGPVNSGGAGRFYSRRNTYFNSNGH